MCVCVCACVRKCVVCRDAVLATKSYLTEGFWLHRFQTSIWRRKLRLGPKSVTPKYRQWGWLKNSSKQLITANGNQLGEETKGVNRYERNGTKSETAEGRGEQNTERFASKNMKQNQNFIPHSVILSSNRLTDRGYMVFVNPYSY